MPWDNNTGGGGRNGGPWGQTPGGGGPRKPGGTPSLEDILSRGRDRFGGGLPGGTHWVILVGVLVVAAFWVSQCVYTVEPQEVGVELLFGKPQQQVSEPGLHFMFWPAETVRKVNVTQNQTTIGTGTTSRSSGSGDEGLMLTGDQNIVNVRFSVFWEISDPQMYLFNVRNPDDMVRYAAESAMREVVGRSPVQDIYRTDQAGIANEVQKITQGTLDEYKMGVQINAIRIENAAPPTEVADAFAEVQRAEQDQTRFQQEAQQYANTLLGNARGQAAKIREDAAAYKDRVVKEAEGEAARFTSVYDAYVKAPDVTRKRLYLETLEQILGTSQKVLIDKGAAGSGVVPYLPLPELKPGTIAPQNDNSSVSAGDQLTSGATGSDSSGGDQTSVSPTSSSTSVSQ